MNQHLALLEIQPSAIPRPGSLLITLWFILWLACCVKHSINMIRYSRCRAVQMIYGRHLCLSPWTTDTQHLIMRSLELLCKRYSSCMVDQNMIKTTQMVYQLQSRSHAKVVKC